MTNTALSAKAEQIAQTVTFRNDKHRRFFLEYLPKCRYADVYHAALVYCLGIDEDTRKNVNSIYDFKTGCVKTECLHEGWITSGSAKIIRMAYNLYNNGTPSVYDYQQYQAAEVNHRRGNQKGKCHAKRQAGARKSNEQRN